MSPWDVLHLISHRVSQKLPFEKSSKFDCWFLENVPPTTILFHPPAYQFWQQVPSKKKLHNEVLCTQLRLKLSSEICEVFALNLRFFQPLYYSNPATIPTSSSINFWDFAQLLETTEYSMLQTRRPVKFYIYYFWNKVQISYAWKINIVFYRLIKKEIWG